MSLLFAARWHLMAVKMCSFAIVVVAVVFGLRSFGGGGSVNSINSINSGNMDNMGNIGSIVARALTKYP